LLKFLKNQPKNYLKKLKIFKKLSKFSSEKQKFFIFKLKISSKSLYQAYKNKFLLSIIIQIYSIILIIHTLTLIIFIILIVIN
jgi:hypothetical protein